MSKKLLAVVMAAALLGVGGATWEVRGDGVAPAGLSGAAEQKLTDAQIKALIEKLGAEDFKTRSAAHKDLVAAGPAALPALETASHSSDAEVAEQAKVAMQEIRRGLATAASDTIAKQQLWVYAMEKGAAWTNAAVWPVIYGGTAYVGGMDGKLHAVDIQTGKARWTTQAGPLMGFSGAQVSAGDKVVSAISAMTLTVYDTKEGKQLWQKDFKPVNANGGNGGGNVPAGVPAPAKNPAPAGGGAAAGAGPAAGGGAVAKPGFVMGFGGPMAFSRPEAYVAGDVVVVRIGDEVKGYKALSGEEAWKMDVKRAGAMQCNTVVTDAVAYVCTDQSVAALDLTGQKEMWKQELPGCRKLAKSGSTLVCVAGSKVVALDSKKGTRNWEVDMTPAAPAADPNMPAGGANVPGGAANAPAGAFNGKFVMSGGIIARKAAVDDTRVYVVVNEVLTTLDLKNGAKAVVSLDMGDEKEAGGVVATKVPWQGGGAAGGGAAAGGGNMVVSSMRMKPTINQVAAADGVLYGVATGGIFAFDGKTGAKLWFLPQKYNLPTEPVAAGGVLYFATTGQSVFGFQNGAHFAPIQPGPGLQPLPPGQPAVPAAEAVADSPILQPGLHAVKVAK